ncbi:MAG TPA: hypothetical protein VHR66_07625 [Gemmataceae bacterium]|jgi:hypothetical protein|nr:hypothetical protein [Gemmataceae bacterium]
MIRFAVVACFAVVLCMPAAVHALATEQLGNEPIKDGWGFSSQLLAAVNIEERVYWYEVNGNPTFFFKGSAKALNQAIRRFVDIPADRREIILLPGPGGTHTLGGKPVACDWSLHVPMGDFGVADTRATLTIYVNALVPAPPKNMEQVKKWIDQLNSDDFKTRELAAKELTAIGRPVAASLRRAMNETKAAETRDRLERVLAGMSGAIAIDILEIPTSTPVVDLQILLERTRKELANTNPDVRGHAATSLSRRPITPEDVLPDLEKLLKTERHEYPLRCAISSASRLGAAGKPLLPILQELQKSKDENVVNAAKYAVDAIEKAKPVAIDKTEHETQVSMRKEIREFAQERDKSRK